MNKRKFSKNNKDGRKDRNKHGDDDSKQTTQVNLQMFQQ